VPVRILAIRSLPKITPSFALPFTSRRPVLAGCTRSNTDGHRLVAYLARGTARLITRNGNDATQRFAPVARMLEQLRIKQAIIDCEVAVPDERSVTNISLLDDALATGVLERFVFCAIASAS
jgi:hypothetical protein